jgi:hypothetical protein
LRRILETASVQVTCALEVRRLECMAEPIQSRCILKRLTNQGDVTWRQKKIQIKWALPDDFKVPVMEIPTSLSELRTARLSGADPYKIMRQIARGHRLEREVLKRSTMGMSPWILSAWILSQN